MISQDEILWRQREAQLKATLDRRAQISFAREEGIEKGREEGIEKGREEGIEKGALHTLTHQFERRLGRPLAEVEAAFLADNVRALGADVVGDVVLERDAEGLVDWLTGR